MARLSSTGVNGRPLNPDTKAMLEDAARDLANPHIGPKTRAEIAERVGHLLSPGEIERSHNFTTAHTLGLGLVPDSGPSSPS